ncbi:galacturonosyltransferase 14 [Hordeum vulgare]|nr:galacturonosyltransferase 14 [Hordeum vulgare]
MERRLWGGAGQLSRFLGPALSVRVDLIACYVAPAVTHGTNTPARKRQGNVVMQGGNPAGPAGKACALGATATARSAGPPAEKMSKVLDVNRKKIPIKRSAPSSTPSAPSRCSPMMPLNDAASTPYEMFDKMAGSGGSNNAAGEFVNLLDTNAVDIDQASIADFDYNEMEGGVDAHGGEDEVK